MEDCSFAVQVMFLVFLGGSFGLFCFSGEFVSIRLGLLKVLSSASHFR